MKVSTRIVVSGVVQGVSYRKHTRCMATSLGVNGWVRNLPDGNVEAHLEGEGTAVEALLAWCSVGPERAVVDDLTVEHDIFAGYQDFQIRVEDSLAA